MWHASVPRSFLLLSNIPLCGQTTSSSRVYVGKGKVKRRGQKIRLLPPDLKWREWATAAKNHPDAPRCVASASRVVRGRAAARLTWTRAAFRELIV